MRPSLLPHTEITFRAVQGGVKLVKAESRGRRGRRLVERMTGRGDGQLSTDEIMRLTRGDV